MNDQVMREVAAELQTWTGEVESAFWRAAGGRFEQKAGRPGSENFRMVHVDIRVGPGMFDADRPARYTEYAGQVLANVVASKGSSCVSALQGSICPNLSDGDAVFRVDAVFWKE